MNRILHTHRVHVELDQPIGSDDDVDVPAVFSWRTAGVAAAMLFAIVALLTFLTVIGG